MSTLRCSPLSIALACVVAAAGALPAQAPTPNGAGFGGVYRDIALDSQTGVGLHLGVAVDTTTGHVFVSATGQLGLPPHRIHEFDAQGNYLTSFAQPAVHDGSSFGMRDLEFDGQSLLGGSEAGISVLSPTGQPVNQILAANGPQPISQPIRGQVLAVLGVIRALALDPNGNQGNGSLLVADFGSPIHEIDFAGNVLRTFPNLGWSAYGLAIDPLTGNVWVNAGADGSSIVELDRATMAPTGRSFAPVVQGGAQGGLSLASPHAGHHEPWPNQVAFAHLVQAAEDRVGISRLHLFPGVFGWQEPVLQIGTNGGSLVAGNAPFRRGDTLELRVADPTGTMNGQPVWTIVDFYFDAAARGYTDLSPVLPGTGILWEHRTLNAISVPASSTFVIVAQAVGATLSIPLPPQFMVLDGDLLRAQTLYLQPASPQGIGSTNEANWIGGGGERGIVVAAAGPTSFNAGTYPPFWTVHSDGTHTHGAILEVEFTVVGAIGQAAMQRFDIDQLGMGDRFDGGNATAPGCQGTYRNGSDLLCGLDYAAPGVHTIACHTAGQSSGVRFRQPPDSNGNTLELIFAFSAFTPGKAFEFDCDTDGAPPTGADHAGLVVHVTTANSGVLTGLLQLDPVRPNRSVVWFP